MSDPLVYYATPGPVTTIPNNPIAADLLAGLPTTIPELARAVQNNILHIFWASRYDVELSDARKAEVQIRSVAEMLRRIHVVDSAPLTTPRSHDQKLVGNCRDFTVLMVALLQRQGIPARARCGFGSYFLPGKYEDHWVAEYWNADESRWIQVDAQLDAFQCEQLKTDFDPFDVPHDRFLSGGRAWQMTRDQGVDPDLFGIFDMRGYWFIRGDLVRDFAALNQMPLLPWDSWGLCLGADDDLSDDDWALLDRIAALSLDNAAFDEVRALYDADERLRVPPVIMSFPTGPEPVAITLAEVLAAG